jgi:hypothetical protein
MTISVEETTFQPNRNANINVYLPIGETTAESGGPRQYGIYIDGFMSENGTSEAREFRGYAYNLGTNVNDREQDIRGLKGRVYATGGSANIRGIYSVVDVKENCGFDGYLTGVLSTLFVNGAVLEDAVGYRAHLSTGCTAAFEAASTGQENETGQFKFAFRVRGGENQPGLPTVACFAAHGGGTGDLFVGYKDHLNQTSSDRIFRAKNNGELLAASSYSGRVTIANDSVATITAPSQSGMVEMYTETTLGAWGRAYYRASGTAAVEVSYQGSNVETGTGTPVGNTGTPGKIGMYTSSDGKIHFENRLGATKAVVYHFMAGTGA